MIALRILLDGMDFIVEKPRCFCSCMGNQRFGLGKFELEFLLQEGSEAVLDFLRFLLWANKSQQKVIGIPTVPESSIVGVVEEPVRAAAALVFSLLAPLLAALFGTGKRLGA